MKRENLPVSLFTKEGKREGKGRGNRLKVLIALSNLIIISTLTLLMFVQVYSATIIDERAGTVGGLVMDMGVGAKAVSLGEAYTAGYGTSDAYFWNPGAYGISPRYQFSFSHNEWLLSSRMEHISASVPLGEFGVVRNKRGIY